MYWYIEGKASKVSTKSGPVYKWARLWKGWYIEGLGYGWVGISRG
jgi:hypothetical protein